MQQREKTVYNNKFTICNFLFRSPTMWTTPILHHKNVLLSRLKGRSSIDVSLEVTEDLVLRRARVVPNWMNNTGYSCSSFINYNLSVYSLTNLFNRDTNHGNDNIIGHRALLASQTLSIFSDTQVDEIFKTNVYKAHFGKPTPNFYKK